MPQLSINQYRILDEAKYDKTLARFRPTQDNKWPAGEIDQVDGRYVGFSVTAPADKEVLIEEISFVVGAAATNSIRYRARYSKVCTYGVCAHYYYFHDNLMLARSTLGFAKKQVGKLTSQ